MARISPSSPSQDFGELQKLVDDLFRESATGTVKRVDLVVRAEVNDLSEPQAHRALQRISMNLGLRMSDSAKRILNGDELQ